MFSLPNTVALSEPPGRYITVDTQSNLETALIFQMVAYFTGVNLTDRSEVISCKECLQQMEGKVRDNCPSVFSLPTIFITR